MKLERVENKYVISNLDLEMVQFLLNSLYTEQKRLKTKVSQIKPFLFKNYSDEQKEQFKVQIDFINQKIVDINETIDNVSKEFEQIIL